MSFSNYIKRVKYEKKINQSALADKLDVSRNAIKLIEDGSTKYPSDKVLNNLSEYLDIPRYTIMAEILFGKEESEDKPIKYDYQPIENYLAYMYLRGWNIEIYNKELIKARVIKKREPKNIIFVTSYFSFDYLWKEEGEDEFIGSILVHIMRLNEEYRGLHLVFDANSEDQWSIYKRIEQFISLKRITFDFEIVLFDSEKGRISESVNLRNK